VVGRFLEHSRVFYFHNDGAEDVYLSSADWMERNFFRRVEICFPVLDPQLKKRVIHEGLKPYLEDNGQAWKMGEDGEYHVESPQQGSRVVAQETLLKLLAQHAVA
jgi:polyphosphate kinase